MDVALENAQNGLPKVQRGKLFVKSLRQKDRVEKTSIKGVPF